MSVNADFVRRFRGLDQELGGVAQDVAKVQIVDDGSYRGSRERAPYARHWSTVAAGGAATNNGFYISGWDRKGVALVLLQRFVASGTCTVFIANPASLTLATDVAVTPVAMDLDAEVSPIIHEISIATANIPAAGSGVCDQFPSNGDQITTYAPMIAHWFSQGQTPNNAFFCINATAVAIMRYNVHWQVVRA